MIGITCRVCAKPNPEHIFHCAEHYHCADCGTKDHLCTYLEDVLCGPCHKLRVEKRTQEFQAKLGDDSMLTQYTDEIVCPHCGHEHSNSFEVSDGIHECSDCCKPFAVIRDIQVTYCTEKA